MRMIRPPLRVAEQGFTLLEIMVVVVIIGLLAAIVAPNFIGNIDTAAINRARTGHPRHRDGAESVSARQFPLSEHARKARRRS